jgi:hypothetical protein
MIKDKRFLGWTVRDNPARPFPLRLSARFAREVWGLFLCCLYSVDMMQNCEGSLSRDNFLF